MSKSAIFITNISLYETLMGPSFDVFDTEVVVDIGNGHRGSGKSVVFQIINMNNILNNKIKTIINYLQHIWLY